MDREQLGRLVRETWVKWAQQQPSPKPHWLHPYNKLAEPDKEVDRLIGEAVRDATAPTWKLYDPSIVMDYGFYALLFRNRHVTLAWRHPDWWQYAVKYTSDVTAYLRLPEPYVIETDGGHDVLRRFDHVDEGGQSGTVAAGVAGQTL